MKKVRRLEEVDGLRAVALIGVLLYHARLGLFFQGGFVGVDAFFVISGYVVTLSLLRQIRQDKFSFTRFLFRRVQRLLPALLVTIAWSNEIIRHIFTEDHRREASKLSIAATFSVSNIVLWLQSNYFDTDSRLKPYLHTWSLSVEWQFYLSWALLSKFIYTHIQRKQTQLTFLSVIFIFSLLSTTLIIPKHPSAAFYNILFRYCEFMVGSIPAWYGFISSKPSIVNDNNEIAPIKTSCIPFHELYTWSALAVILGYFVLFKDSYSFPGLSVIPLCMASAVMITYSGRSYLCRVLRHKIIQWLGDISYSVYLVHWPMLVFVDYALLSKSSSIQRFIVVLLSVAVGHVLNRVVERPFHKQEGIVFKLGSRTKNTIILLLATLVMIQSNEMIFSSKHKDVFATKTWISRVLNRSMRLKSKRKHENRGHFGTLCHMTGRYPEPTNFDKCNPSSKRSIVLFGDSHAQDFYAALNSSLFPNTTVIQLTAAGFSFTEKFRDGPYKHCKIMYDAYPKLLENRRKSIIGAILASRWKPGIKLEDLNRLNNTLEYFKKNLSVPAFVIGPRPEFAVAPLRILETQSKVNSSQEEIQKLFDDGMRFKHQVDEVLKPVVESWNSSYLPSIDAFCDSATTHDAQKCSIFSTNKTFIYYTDRHHINSRGAAKIIGPVISAVRKLGNKGK